MQQEKAARRRRRIPPEKQRALVAAWQSSGQTAREFAHREGLHTSCLWRWKRAHGEGPAVGAKSRPSIAFAPVHVAKVEPKQVVAGSRVLLDVMIERELCVRVYDGADVEAASRFVRALARRTAC